MHQYLICYRKQKVYNCLVRLHDDYDMHETFLPGFPGLLEAFYVQEKIMQKTLPGIYAVFVCSFPVCVLKF
jgi:USP6 N-terminal-like protein